MRAGLSTILQTLTPEAASVLNQSIAEASRRCHGQTTPLHVAATLLASPTGILRQACVRSHPNTSHPLQCRALELCFSVALDRLPSVSGGNSNPAADLQPPISNALMAALKRAQANQRRGCPEQQQQPLLAIKVELEQLIISILDDPSVSRVMREASFSSPAVKAAVEQSIAATAAAAPTATATTTISAVAAAGGPTTVTSTATSATSAAAASPGSNSANSSILSGFGFRATPAAPAIPFLLGNRNLYVNPRLQQTPKSAAAPSVGSSTPAGEEKEEIRKAFDILLKRKKRNPILVGDAQPEAVAKELLQKIERKGIGQGFPGNVEIIPVEKKLSGAPDASHITQILQELSNSIDRRLNDGGGAAVVLDLGDLRWLVERADGVSSAVVSEMKKLLARFSEGGRVWLVGCASSATYLRCQVYNPSVELDWDLQALPIASRPPLSSLPSRSESNLLAGGSPPAIPGSRVRCPLEKAAPPRSEMCAHCKDSYERELAKLVAMEFEKSNLGSKPDKPLPPWLQLAKLSSGDSAASPAATQSQTREQELSWKKTTEELLKRWSETCSRLHLNPRQAKLQPPAPPVDHPAVPPASSVTTDLVLGCEKSPPAKSAPVDFDSFKRLFKGLAEKVSWQQEAASAVAATVMQCRSGSGRRAARGDTWLLFTGPDLMGKRKMAAALAALLVNAEPFTVSFGGASVPEEKAGLSRGRTAMDRVAEALRRNPSSVIVLDGIDSADMLVLGNLRRAMERARLPDSHGREVPLGRAVFILVSGGGAAEEKLLAAAKSGWQLELAAPEKPGKRRAEQWSPANPKPPRLSLDLNLAAGASDEDSSDLTVEHDVCGGGAAPDSKWEFLRSAVDAAVEFKPVDFRELRRKVADTMARKFRAAAGEGRTLVVDDETVDRLVGGLWFGSTPAAAFDEWAETVVVPSFRQLRNQSAAAAPTVKLLPLKDSGGGGGGAAAAALPTKVRVTLKFSDRPALSDGLFLPCN